MSPAAPPLVPTTQQPSEYSSLIERAAFTENFDVQKLQALLDMRESEEMRRAEKAFNASLVRAQSEMSPVVADANNPQTRSRYATYAALDRAIRPHYTAHGLAPSFGTEPLTEAGHDARRRHPRAHRRVSRAATRSTCRLIPRALAAAM